jgi:hypothetical protein
MKWHKLGDMNMDAEQMMAEMLRRKNRRLDDVNEPDLA